jgi:hypothetical protein
MQNRACHCGAETHVKQRGEGLVMGLLSVGTVTVVIIVDASGRIGDVRPSKIESVAIRAERHGTVDWGKAKERGGTVWMV